MPYKWRKVPNKDLYIVRLVENNKILGRTKNPQKMISAIEISKLKKTKG